MKHYTRKDFDRTVEQRPPILFLVVVALIAAATLALLVSVLV